MSHPRQSFPQNLCSVLRIRGVTQADAAAAAGVSPSTMSDWCNGKKYPRVESMTRLAQYLCVPLSRLTEEAFDPLSVNGVEPASTYPVPILGTIACGTPILAEQNVEGTAHVEVSLRADFALRCKGDSMLPKLMDGDVVFIRQQDDVTDGQIAAVLIDSEATLKHVYRLPDGAGVQLVSDNPAYPPMLYIGENARTIRILGRAVGYQRALG